MTTLTAPQQQSNGRTMMQAVGDRNSLRGLLDQMKDSIMDVLPRHLTPDRVLKMALVAASRTPKLFDCTRQSIAQAIMRSSELGLDCSGTLGSGYLVPYYNGKLRAFECQFIPGYRGLIELARRSGEILSIEARVVYANDTFDIDLGRNPPIAHKPKLCGDRGDVVLVYAQAYLKGTDRPQVEYMTVDEIDGIRRRSKASDSGPWVTDWSEMARKTVVRRLCKYLPLSPELEQAISIDAEVEGSSDYASTIVREVSTAQPSDGTRTDALVDRLTAQQDPTDEPAPEDPEASDGSPSDDERRAIRWEELCAALADKQGASSDAAASKLADFVGKVLKASPDSLTDEQYSDLAAKIAAGDIVVHKSKR